MLIESLSGIRGIFGQELTEEIVKGYAASFCEGKKRIALGYDTRQSNQTIKRWITEVSGGTILDVGILPTPAICMALKALKADAGIIITASHNEPEFNGLKLLGKDGSIITEKEFFKLKNEKDRVKITFSKAKVLDKRKEALDSYLKFVFSNLSKKDLLNIKASKIKLLLDPNGGASIPVLKEIMPKLGIRFKILNEALGTFSRKIEPTIASLDYLNLEGYDFAAAFDCDSDRIEFVLPKNADFAIKHSPVVDGNYVLAMAIDEVLSGRKSDVIVNLATSNLVAAIAQKHKSKIIIVDVGETNIVQAMKKNKAIIGGEGSSGGVIISPGKSRDGILTLLIVLKFLARKKQSLDSVLCSYPQFFSFQRKIIANSFNPEKIKASFQKSKIIESGYGIRVEIGESWIFFRPSKTEHGILRVITDSTSPEKASKLMNIAMQTLEA
jgi:phosphomannomutase